MIRLGLTGSIGMGKSTAACLLRRLGVPVFDADREVHALLARGGGAVAQVEAAFPGVAVDGAVDRTALGGRVFSDAEALARLEAIVHPLVRRREQVFMRAAGRRRAPVVAFDIPLLFETAGASNYDATVVVTAPEFVQAARVLGRPDMTSKRFADILERQMSDRDKRRRADFVVPTGLGQRLTLHRLKQIVTRMRRRGGARGRRRLGLESRVA